jgi:chaperone required for assembly of F1-ATPase
MTMMVSSGAKIQGNCMNEYIAVKVNDTLLTTPGKNPLAVPTKALADAIAAEWVEAGKYSPAKTPLTTLAYTAIDRIDGQKDLIVETLLVYVETDTLSYRASASETLANQQNTQWGPILDWAKKTYGTTWEVTSGVMPVDQPPELFTALEKRLSQFDAMQLAAACVLASSFSSLALMMAVMENHIDAAEGFRLSRLEEESQAQTWGRDMEAEARAARLKEEILTAVQFLGLLARA